MKHVCLEISGSAGEIFKPLREDPRYLVGNCGTVISTVSGFNRRLACSVDGKGYPTFQVGGRIIRLNVKVHRAVATLFIPNPDAKPEINHKNGIRHDNRVSNLEWVTRRENIIHAFKELPRKIPRGLSHGWYTKPQSRCFGTKNGHAIFTNEQVIAVRLAFEGGQTVRSLCEQYGAGNNTIRSIIKRRTWRHL